MIARTVLTPHRARRILAETSSQAGRDTPPSTRHEQNTRTPPISVPPDNRHRTPHFCFALLKRRRLDCAPAVARDSPPPGLATRGRNARAGSKTPSSVIGPGTRSAMGHGGDGPGGTALGVGPVPARSAPCTRPASLSPMEPRCLRCATRRHRARLTPHSRASLGHQRQRRYPARCRQ